MDKETKHFDVIIIGGGISGLYTASRLLENNMKVLVIEKNNSLGGKIHTINYDGYHFEAGAGRFSNHHTHLIKLMDKYKLSKIQIGKMLVYKSNVATENMSFMDINKQLKIVIKHAKTMQKEQLMQITFKDLCIAALGTTMANNVQNGFGYNAEFEYMNAYDATIMFKSDYSIANTVYYVCGEGLSKLIECIVNELLKHPNCTLVRNTTVNMIDFENDNIYVHESNGDKYVGKTVVAALPKDDLLKMNIFNAKQRKMLNSVASISLHRIYAAWDTKNIWFKNISKTTTDNHIRQFIPIDSRNGLAMVSYSDTKDADYWEKKKRTGVDSLWNPLKKLLNNVFIKPIEPPKWIKSYYWSAGVHVWKPKYDSTILIPQIRHIMGTDVPFYIVGESYCKHQGWIEGALISVEELIQDMRKNSHL